MPLVLVFSEMGLVPGEGFEPPTFGLQNRCTTAVLTRRRQGLFTGGGRCAPPSRGASRAHSHPKRRAHGLEAPPRNSARGETV